jgi:ABC-type polysaccharide/polyol phosphate transport system ATPase subunit
MSRDQIDEKFDSIVEFSGLEDVIDAPMRTYSSGMQSRLAFSVAASLDPDIFIIDEALSTGDARFKVKSIERIRQMKSDDRALIVVSHALKVLREICDEIIWMDKGRMVKRGEPLEVIKAYRAFLHVGSSPETDEDF